MSKNFQQDNCLELPLDHFRLIGVSPSATSEEILRSFQLRLDKTPDEGFTYEVLTQRSELLRLTADLLTDPESRREYENLLLNGKSGLEFPSNREVAAVSYTHLTLPTICSV